MQRKEILGVDIGGGGIKAAIVDVNSGNWRDKDSQWFTTEMLKNGKFPKGYTKNNLWYEIETSRDKKPTPTELRAIFEKIIAYFNWKGKVGVGFPAIVQNGIVKSASNIHQNWLNTDLSKFLSSNLPQIEVAAFNDADAAGIGEATLGSGKDKKGSVLVLTVGTGIGSALLIDGTLVPNTEFGHFYIKTNVDKYGKECELAEDFASNYIRKQNKLEWKTWATERFKEYLRCIQRLLSPDCIIIGGGAGKEKRFNKYAEYLIDTDEQFDVYAKRHKTDGRAKIETEIIPAKLQNYAGIIGAAVGAGLQYQ